MNVTTESIWAGAQLLHYRLIEKIGEGGMGVVWRAIDTALDREVAIKILPEALTGDRMHLARFEREAKLLASLTHANIAVVYGLHRAEGLHFVAMELVPGEDLSKRLARGALPVGEALEVAHQICKALEAAHEHGVVHRDLKPANIQMCKDGSVKVLDFGLAKALATERPAPNGSSSLTLTVAATRAGTILGTAAYMAPEQASGLPVDQRADIWAFGAVLWEMLTGRRLFDGDSVPETLAGVLNGQPDFSQLPADVPPRIRRLIFRCLRKKPRERLQAIGDARVVLDEVLAGNLVDAPTSAISSGVSSTLPTRRWPSRAALVALLLATVLLGAVVVRERFAPPRIVRVSILPPPEVSFYLHPGRPGPVAVSPDGRKLAFTGVDSHGGRSIWLRSLDTLEARKLPSTEDGHYPFWSSDSRYVGFFTETDLKKIAIAGGPPVTLAKVLLGKGGTWNDHGAIVFARTRDGPLHVVDASGGDSHPITELAPGDVSHRHPYFLPDDKHFLFVVRRSRRGDNELRVGALDGSKPIPILPTDANAAYAEGRLLFLRGDTLLAQSFDPDSLRLSGEPTPLAESVRCVPGALVGAFSVSREGTLVYHTGASASDVRLVWRDRTGAELGTLGDPALQLAPRLSPDGRRIAVEIDDASSAERDLWIYDRESGLRSRFTFDVAGDPLWSPDGKTLAFVSRRVSGIDAVWSVPVAGDESPRRLAAAGKRGFSIDSWSPDGKWILATASGAKGADIVRIPARGGEPEPLLAHEHAERDGAVSPDGRWLAYCSNETGREEVYVTGFPEPGRKWQVSTGGGLMPTWRTDGRELFYRDNSALYAVDVDGRGSSFRVGAVHRLFDIPARFTPSRLYEATSDGQRFLIAEPLSSGADASPVTLVLNWDAGSVES